MADKCRNCAGMALDEATDEIVDCGCRECAEHQAIRAEAVAYRDAEWRDE